MASATEWQLSPAECPASCIDGEQQNVFAIVDSLA